MSPSPLELSALGDLCLAIAQRGRSCEFLGSPETDPANPLNVDACIKIAGVVWVVEHMRVMPDEATVPAHREAEKVLLPKLEAIAARYGVKLSVALYPPRRTELGKDGVGAVYDEVLEAAARAAAAGRSDLNRRYQIHVVAGDGASANLSFFTADDPLVANQVRRGVRVPLGAKLSNQLNRANELGLPVLLLLDQVDDATKPVQPQWLPAPETIWQVVSEILNESATRIDEVWLRRPNRELIRLRSVDDPQSRRSGESDELQT